MKKLLIGVAIALFMVFTAGLATAAEPTPSSPQTFTYTTGNLWFMSTSGSTPTMVTGTILTLNQVVPAQPNADGEPCDIWYGTLTFPAGSPLGSSTTVVDVITFRGPDDPWLFHNIHGTIGTTGGLGAEGTIGVIAKDFDRSPPAFKKGFYIRGTINDGSTFVGNFEGTLFP